ncbi:uncharacterized protein LOC143288237 [Babylonia areolata]|uniref:uncharacterized protein LOC143288237 n=1 Tax=Babylonia areolata TaxID=304850 RepID=UPI003FD5D984
MSLTATDPAVQQLERAHTLGWKQEAVTIIVWVFLIVGSHPQSSPDVITCQAVLNHVATVTCHFRFDLNVTKKDFIVTYYRPQDRESRIIVACNWNGQLVPDCYVEDSTQFDYVVTDRLTAKVARNTSQPGGEFHCELVPSRGYPSRRCRLLNSTTTTTDSSTTVVPLTSQATSDNSDECADHTSPVVTSVFVTILLTALVCVAVFYCLLRRSSIGVKRLLSGRFEAPMSAGGEDTGAAASPLNTDAAPDACAPAIRA